MPSYSFTVKGLSEGEHYFSFNIDDGFFAMFDGSEVQRGKLKAEVYVEKTANVIKIRTHIDGFVAVECDRCLDELRLPVDSVYDAVIKHAPEGEQTQVDDEGVILLNKMDTEVDLSQSLFDSIILSLPLQRLHPKGKCNKEMEAKLASLQVN